jgi:hypothetical protein
VEPAVDLEHHLVPDVALKNSRKEENPEYFGDKFDVLVLIREPQNDEAAEEMIGVMQAGKSIEGETGVLNETVDSHPYKEKTRAPQKNSFHEVFIWIFYRKRMSSFGRLVAPPGAEG